MKLPPKSMQYYLTINYVDSLTSQFEIQVRNLPKCKTDHECRYDRSDTYGSKSIWIPQYTHHKSYSHHCSVKSNLYCWKPPICYHGYRLNASLTRKRSDICRHIDEYSKGNQKYAQHQIQNIKRNCRLKRNEWNQIQCHISEISKHYTIDELQQSSFLEPWPQYQKLNENQCRIKEKCRYSNVNIGYQSQGIGNWAYRSCSESGIDWKGHPQRHYEKTNRKWTNPFKHIIIIYPPSFLNHPPSIGKIFADNNL